MDRKKPRMGLLLLFVALGSGVVGYFVGGISAETPPPPRGDPRPFLVVPDALPRIESLEANLPGDVEPPGEGAGTAPAAEPVPVSELLHSLRENAGSERGQMILLGMVADAARRGSEALPELRELLDSGVDIAFPGYKGQGLGYPSLRVALLAAAEATGDPDAIRLIAEVAQTTESPVEVVFGAHLLDRLEALDAPTAQRTLDALSRELTPEQRKAMGAVAGKVLPAVAAADPAYAEQFLTLQLRAVPGKGAGARFATGVLDGLPADRARDLVLSNLTAADVHERSKQALAARAAQRREVTILGELRTVIESGAVTPRVASAIAHGSLGGPSYGGLERAVRHSLKEGDVEQARKYVGWYQARLGETKRTIEAARTMGAPLRPDLETQLRLRNQRIDMLRAQIAQTLKKQQQKKN